MVVMAVVMMMVMLMTAMETEWETVARCEDYTSRVLIVEVPDNDWKNDHMLAKFADLIGVKTKLQI